MVGQTALTMTRLAGCGLLLRSFVAATGVDLGYDPDDVLFVDVTLPDQLYRDPVRRMAFYEQALGDLRALPGVGEVGLTSVQPFVTSAWMGSVARAGGTERVRAAFRYVDAGYFRALRIPLVRGEVMHPSDPATPDVVLDAGLASQLWPDGEAIGGALEWPSRVVDIVGSVREWNDDEGVGTIYVDWHAFPDRLLHMYVMIRHDGRVAEILPQVRRVLGGRSTGWCPSRRGRFPRSCARSSRTDGCSWSSRSRSPAWHPRSPPRRVCRRRLHDAAAAARGRDSHVAGGAGR